jgi:hypothetical protein
VRRGLPRSTALRSLLRGVVFAGVVFFGGLGAAQAASRVFVEIGETGDRLNPAVVRRLVALELSEINVPDDPRFDGDEEREVTLHCRVLPEDGALRVEIWALGQSAGARRVSLQGTPALVARRVALAAAELTRRLADVRRAEARRLDREAKEAELAARRRAESERRRRLALGARARGIAFTEGAYWTGPAVGAQLNGDHPLRVELSMSWMAGQLTSLDGAPTWSALELSVEPGWVVPLTPSVDLAVGVPLAAALVNTQGEVTVDRIPGQRDTWTARGGLSAHVQPRLSRHLRLDASLAGGWVLRSVPLDRTEGSADVHRERLGGPWVEVSVGVLLD